MAVNLFVSKSIAVMAWVCLAAGSIVGNATMEVHMSAYVCVDVVMPAAAWGLVAKANPRL